MSKDPDVVAGEPIEAAWGNQSIRDKTVQRMTSEADRDTSIPAPGDGETVWIEDQNLLQIWTGTVWTSFSSVLAGDFRVVGKIIVTADPSMELAGSLTTHGTQHVDGAITTASTFNATGTITGGEVISVNPISFGQFWHRNVWIDRSPTTPTGITTGDIWIDSESGTVQAWSGTEWVLLIQGVT